MGTSDAVRQLLDELAAAYTERDPKRALDLFADDIVFVGTGGDELRLGRKEVGEQISRDLTQAESLTVEVTDVHVGDAEVLEQAWFFAHIALEATVDGDLVSMPMRMTGVASTNDGEPRFRQTHFSLPFGEQAAGQSFAPASTEPKAVVERFRSALASGDHSSFFEIYAEDAIFDVNLPEWRFQLQGPDSIRGQYDEWHPEAPNLVEWRERATDRGVLVELALWEGDGHNLYSRSLHDLEIEGDRITRHVMYCTGDWTKEALTEAAASFLV